MSEIAAIPWNSLIVASLFAGCGGSSLGYRMAGFRVLYALDSDPAARKSYAANMVPGTILDDRDVRRVKGQEIVDACGGVAPDVLDGSPPCVSFSTAGKRASGWGKVRSHAGLRQMQDDLFFEYLRLVSEVMPRAFVAENVSGMIKGVAKGYFIEVMTEAKRLGYHTKCKLLDAQWLGVPQARQRVIFIGLRKDLGIEPDFPTPIPHRYSLRDACPWIIREITSHGAREADQAPAATITSGGYDVTATAKFGGLGMAEARQIIGNDGFKPKWGTIDQPHPTIMAQGACGSSGMIQVEAGADIARFAIDKDSASIPEGGKSARYLNLQRAHRDKPCPTITAEGGNSSLASTIHPTEQRKFTIAELKRICAFPDDFELVGTYAEQWARLGNSVPPVMMRHVAERVAASLAIA